MTPTPSESGAFSHAASSSHLSISDAPSPNTSLSIVDLPSQSSSQTATDALALLPASVGLCNLATENQLKANLLGQDRIYLLVLSREIEAFVERVVSGVQPATTPIRTSTSIFAALGPFFKLETVAGSKFQKMLQYKLAEWYGLRAAPGPEGSMVIGVLESMHEKT